MQSLASAGIWDEPCQPVEFWHDQRVPCVHGGEGQHYRMVRPTCSPPSSSTGIRPSRRSGQATETRRTDSQAKDPSPHLTPWAGQHTAHRRIPVVKAPIATLAYDSAPYRNRPDIDCGDILNTARTSLNVKALSFGESSGPDLNADSTIFGLGLRL